MGCQFQAVRVVSAYQWSLTVVSNQALLSTLTYTPDNATPSGTAAGDSDMIYEHSRAVFVAYYEFKCCTTTTYDRVVVAFSSYDIWGEGQSTTIKYQLPYKSALTAFLHNG